MYRDHAHSHAQDKRHTCSKCSKSFKRPRELQAHRKIHKEDGELSHSLLNYSQSLARESH